MAHLLLEILIDPDAGIDRSGADRAGIMSVLYMHFRQGKTIREAMDQLHLRYLHVETRQAAARRIQQTAGE